MSTRTSHSWILVVDDDSAHRFLIKRAISQWTIRDAASISEANSLLAENTDSPCIAFIDLRLSSESGLTLVEQLHKKSSETVIIVISTSPLWSDMTASYRAGAAAYIIKHNDGAEFHQALLNATKWALGTK